ncbi:MAG TPA: ATP synthase F1 subunit gamma [Armatimonadota bacterium]|jgi:F-type H+-transporting ATPase subunit gamma
MATIRDIRRRIKTVRNIQQITQAMKMVATARLQKAQSRASEARPYADEMLAVMQHLGGAANGLIEHPLLEVREPVKTGILVISSDRGMAGSYNTNIIRKVLEITQPLDLDQIKLITVGKRGRGFFAKRDYEIAADFPMASSEVTFSDARDISRALTNMFTSGEVDVVKIVYTRFVSAMRQIVTELQLLPAIPPVEEDSEPGEDYLFEPQPELLLGRLLPRYLDTQVYRAMLESLASEHGARMTAMSSATENAAEMISRLTLDYNRARQSAITTELNEIVSGAEALK